MTQQDCNNVRDTGSQCRQTGKGTPLQSVFLSLMFLSLGLPSHPAITFSFSFFFFLHFYLWLISCGCGWFDNFYCTFVNRINASHMRLFVIFVVLLLNSKKSWSTHKTTDYERCRAANKEIILSYNISLIKVIALKSHLMF